MIKRQFLLSILLKIARYMEKTGETLNLQMRLSSAAHTGSVAHALRSTSQTDAKHCTHQ